MASRSTRNLSTVRTCKSVIQPRPLRQTFLEGHPLRFNISDTKDAVAIAVSKEREVGVDIETTSRKVHHVEVGQHYFTTEEIAAFDIMNSPLQWILYFSHLKVRSCK